MWTANGIGGSETLTANYTDKCPIKCSEVTGKEIWGTYDFRYDSADKITFVRWNGNSVVTLVSNCQSVNPVGTTKCYARSELRITDVPEPALIKYYNKNMRGVHRNQNVSNYRVQFRAKEWLVSFLCLCQIQQYVMLCYCIQNLLIAKTNL